MMTAGWQQRSVSWTVHLPAPRSSRPDRKPRCTPAEPFQLGPAEVIAFLPGADDIPAAGTVGMRDVPAAELAVAVHHGPLADIGQTYGTLGSYVAEREIGVDGPIREHYVVTAADTSDESRHVTAVCWPVFQTSHGS
jgi:hypothetical protein